jgi:hypothetical protein
MLPVHFLSRTVLWSRAGIGIDYKPASKVVRSTRMQCIVVQPYSYCGMNVQRG